MQHLIASQMCHARDVTTKEISLLIKDLYLVIVSLLEEVC